MVLGNCVWYRQSHLPFVTLSSSCLCTSLATPSHLSHESSSSWLCETVADSVCNPLFFSISSHLLSDHIHSHGLKYHSLTGYSFCFLSCSPDFSRLGFWTPTESLTHSFQVDKCNRYPKLHISKTNSWFLTPNICDSFYRFSAFVKEPFHSSCYSWQISFWQFSFSHTPHAIVASLEAVLSKCQNSEHFLSPLSLSL